jgi:hypothetical protein
MFHLPYRTIIRGILTTEFADGVGMSGADIKFRLDSSDAERRVLREYLVDA